MRATILIAAATLMLAPGATRAGPPNPDILVDQVAGAVTRASVRVENLTPQRGALAVANVPSSAGARTAIAQPRNALDRCEAILRGEAQAVKGLDCEVGQLEALRREVEAEPPSSLGTDLDRLSKDLESLTRTPQLTDPATGAPAIAILRAPG